MVGAVVAAGRVVGQAVPAGQLAHQVVAAAFGPGSFAVVADSEHLIEQGGPQQAEDWVVVAAPLVAAELPQALAAVLAAAADFRAMAE